MDWSLLRGFGCTQTSSVAMPTICWFGVELVTMEQHLRIRTDAANVYLHTRALRRILELKRSRNR